MASSVLLMLQNSVPTQELTNSVMLLPLTTFLAYVISQLPKFLAYATSGILAILIPFFVALFSEKYRQEDGFSKLDLLVIFHRLMPLLWLILAILLSFLPVVYPRGAVGVLLIVLGFGGLCKLIWRLSIIYKWCTGDADKYRLEYLKRLRNPKFLPVAWESVWRAKDLAFPLERNYLDLFAEVLADLLSSLERKPQVETLKTIGSLLRDFHELRSNRLVFREPVLRPWVWSDWFSRLLQLLASLYRPHEKAKRENSEYSPYLYDCLDTISSTVNDTLLRAVKQEQASKRGVLALILDELSKHLESLPDDQCRGYGRDLIRMTVSSLLQAADDLLKERTRLDPWHLPASWCITEQNLSSEASVARHLWKVWLEQLESRISSARIDEAFLELSEQIFPPHIDYKTIMKVLMFFRSPYICSTNDPSERAASVCRRGWNIAVEMYIEPVGSDPIPGVADEAKKKEYRTNAFRLLVKYGRSYCGGLEVKDVKAAIDGLERFLPHTVNGDHARSLCEQFLRVMGEFLEFLEQEESSANPPAM